MFRLLKKKRGNLWHQITPLANLSRPKRWFSASMWVFAGVVLLSIDVFPISKTGFSARSVSGKWFCQTQRATCQVNMMATWWHWQRADVNGYGYKGLEDVFSWMYPAVQFDHQRKQSFLVLCGLNAFFGVQDFTNMASHVEQRLLNE